MDDAALLRQFVASRDQQALAALVRRHVDLVYSAARRQVRHDAMAQDVAQQVFIQLAHKAQTIRDGEAVAGWLLVTTRSVALNLLRAEERRRRHEREAAVMKQMQHSDPSPPWDEIAPMLDEAVATLGRDDRDVVAMRYLQGRSVAEVASALGISDVAAQKRCTRAIEKLRGVFAARGVVATPAALASVLTANACTAAPALLAEKITADALGVAASSAGAAGAGASSMAVTKGLVIVMAAAKTKVTAAIAAMLVVLTLGGTVAYHQMSNPRAQTIEITGDWEARFRSVYALDAGQIVKFVPRPFIPERQEYYQASFSIDQVRTNPQGPSWMVLAWEGAEIDWRVSGWGGWMDLESALEAIAGLLPQDIDVPADLVHTTLEGDLVYAGDSTRAQRIAALCEVLSDYHGQRIRIVPLQVERDAIVVSGTFAYQPLGEQPASVPPTIHLFSSELNELENLGNGQGDLGDFFEALAMTTRHQVVFDEPVEKRSRVLWRYHKSGWLRNQPDPDPAIVDAILANVARQTSLNVRRERRVVTVWTLVEPPR